MGPCMLTLDKNKWAVRLQGTSTHHTSILRTISCRSFTHYQGRTWRLHQFDSFYSSPLAFHALPFQIHTSPFAVPFSQRERCQVAQGLATDVYWGQEEPVKKAIKCYPRIKNLSRTT